MNELDDKINQLKKLNNQKIDLSGFLLIFDFEYIEKNYGYDTDHISLIILNKENSKHIVVSDRGYLTLVDASNSLLELNENVSIIDALILLKSTK